jgi:hypothetical protein
MTQRTRMSGVAIAMPGNVVVICGTLARRATKIVMRVTRRVERVREKDRKGFTTTGTGASKLFALLEFFAFVDFCFVRYCWQEPVLLRRQGSEEGSLRV